MLQTIPHLRATTILGELQRRYPGRYPDRLLRSLQRRVAYWRATEGPERELIFRQEHPPGRQALSDFTNGSGLAVTITGAPFPHLLYHFWLAFSGWQYVKAICGGESFTALTEGVQEALWQLGGVPREHRTDRLSAAYRNSRTRRTRRCATPSSAAITAWSRPATTPASAMRTARSRPRTGISRPVSAKRSNCAARATSPTGRLQAFLQEFIARKNAPRRAVLAIELAALLPLPRHRTTDFSTATVTVTRSATISVRSVLYTVPSRLIGCRLKVHIYDDRLVCYLGTTPVLTVGRRHFKRHGPRVRVVDYRHLIGGLVKKPQAFRHSVFREELFPRPVFRRAWEALDARLEPRKACRVYVGLLHLAAMHGCEAALADHLPPCSTPAARPISTRRGRRWRRRPRRARRRCRCLPRTPPVTTGC